MSAPLVSVIVPCYNQGKYLPEALDSVLAQSYTHWECIIINDGSTDETESVAKAYCAKDQRFRYLCQENQGVVAAKNYAILQSQGKYILPLDGDDLLDKSFLEKATAILDHDVEMKIVCCRVKFFGDKDEEMKLGEFTFSDLLLNNYLVNTSLFRRDDCNRVGGYKSEMVRGLEDWELWLSILENGGKVHRIDEVLFYYRIHGQSRNSISQEVFSELHYTVAHIHSRALYNEYKVLYNEYKKCYLAYMQIKRSRSYKLAHACQLLANKYLPVLKFWKKHNVGEVYGFSHHP